MGLYSVRGKITFPANGTEKRRYPWKNWKPSWTGGHAKGTWPAWCWGRGAAGQPFDWLPLPFDPAWIAIVLCGVPIVLEAVIGLVTAFDIKADVLVSIALIASVVIGEDFAAGEVAFIMQLGGLLEDLTVAKARVGIEKLVHLTPRTARVLSPAGEKVVPGGGGPGGRPAPGAPWGDRPGGRGYHQRPDLHQSGGDDRRIAARGQGWGTRSPAAR